jgi:hypothetical protein
MYVNGFDKILYEYEPSESSIIYSTYTAKNKLLNLCETQYCNRVEEFY